MWHKRGLVYLVNCRKKLLVLLLLLLLMLLLLLDVLAHLDCVPCPFSAFAFVGCGLGNLNGGGNPRYGRNNYFRCAIASPYGDGCARGYLEALRCVADGDHVRHQRCIGRLIERNFDGLSAYFLRAPMTAATGCRAGTKGAMAGIILPRGLRMFPSFNFSSGVCSAKSIFVRFKIA